MNSDVRRITSVLVLALLLAGTRAFADDASRFAPPRPPSLDGEIFDDDDDFDLPPDFPGMGGTAPHGGNAPGGHANIVNPSPNGGAPPTNQFNGGYAPSMNDGAGPAAWSQTVNTSAKKFRFKLVEGEFWQKGKRRSRGTQTHVSGGGGGPGGGSDMGG